MADRNELESLAEQWVDRAGVPDQPVDIAGIARANGVALRHGDFTHHVGTRGIVYVKDEPVWRRRYQVAHELGHIIMLVAGYEDAETDEGSADFLASALLCPAKPFLAHWRSVGGDLESMCEAFRVSWEVAARRIVRLSHYVLTIYDRGPRTRERRFASPGLRTNYGRKPSAVERAIADTAFGAREHVIDEPMGFSSWYVPGDDNWERVLMLCQPEELERALAGTKRCREDVDGSWVFDTA